VEGKFLLHKLLMTTMEPRMEGVVKMLARMESMEAKIAQEIIESVKQEDQSNMLWLTALDMSANLLISSSGEN
jgi:Ni,Fe-hydrogenase I small subunit